MKLGWLLFQYAPSDLTLSRAQKREARRRTWKAYRSSARAALFNLGVALTLGLIWASWSVVSDWLTLHLDDRAARASIIGYTILVLGATWVLLAFAGKWMYARAQRIALREMGFDVCLQCGYSLQGLDDRAQHCPECGAKREPMAEAKP